MIHEKDGLFQTSQFVVSMGAYKPYDPTVVKQNQIRPLAATTRDSRTSGPAIIPVQFSTVASKGNTAFFEDMQRQNHGDQWLISHAHSKFPLANGSACYSCHVSGSLQIHPDRTFMDPTYRIPKDPVLEMLKIKYFQEKYGIEAKLATLIAKKNIKLAGMLTKNPKGNRQTISRELDNEINREMQNFVMKTVQGYYDNINERIQASKTVEVEGVDKAGFGPVMGPISREAVSRDGILNKCIPSGSLVRRDKINSAMNCASCHNNRSRGAIYRDPFTNKAFVNYYIKDIGMPPNSNLTAEERNVLAECLYAEMDPKENPAPIINHFTKVSCVSEIETAVQGIEHHNHGPDPASEHDCAN
jgi:hypothetical protein